MVPAQAARVSEDATWTQQWIDSGDRTEAAYPPADAVGRTMPILPGSYVDESGNSADDRTGSSSRTVSQPAPHDVRLAGLAAPDSSHEAPTSSLPTARPPSRCGSTVTVNKGSVTLPLLTKARTINLLGDEASAQAKAPAPTLAEADLEGLTAKTDSVRPVRR